LTPTLTLLLIPVIPAFVATAGEKQTDIPLPVAASSVTAYVVLTLLAVLPQPMAGGRSWVDMLMAEQLAEKP